MQVQPGKRKAEQALWDEHRSTLEHLYITENKTLKDIQQIMLREYSFDRK